MDFPESPLYCKLHPPASHYLLEVLETALHWMLTEALTAKREALKWKWSLLKKKNGTGQDEQTEVDFSSVLLPAIGQRAQNKSGYLASWKQKAEGFKPWEWARGKVPEGKRGGWSTEVLSTFSYSEICRCFFSGINLPVFPNQHHGS